MNRLVISIRLSIVALLSLLLASGAAFGATATSKTWEIKQVGGVKYSNNPSGAPTAPVLGTPTADSSAAITVPITTACKCDSLTAQYRVNGSGTWLTAAAVATNISSYQFTGLAASTAYNFQFVAGANAQTANSGTANGTTTAGSGALFFDSFASGDLSHTENGVSWGASEEPPPNNVGVSGGDLIISYNYDAASGQPRTAYWAEQNILLGNYYSELWIEWVIVIPSNYYHPRPGDPSGYSYGADGSYNNKFILFYDNDYNSPYMLQSIETLYHPTENGASQWAARTFGTHSGGIDINQGVSTYGGSRDFIMLADRGKVATFCIHLKYATAANNDGVMQVWKTVDAVTTNPVNITTAPWYIAGQPGWNKGYLLGAANSAFPATSAANDVDFHTQSVEIGTTNICAVGG